MQFPMRSCLKDWHSQVWRPFNMMESLAWPSWEYRFTNLVFPFFASVGGAFWKSKQIVVKRSLGFSGFVLPITNYSRLNHLFFLSLLTSDVFKIFVRFPIHFESAPYSHWALWGTDFFPKLLDQFCVLWIGRIQHLWQVAFLIGWFLHGQDVPECQKGVLAVKNRKGARLRGLTRWFPEWKETPKPRTVWSPAKKTKMNWNHAWWDLIQEFRNEKGLKYDICLVLQIAQLCASKLSAITICLGLVGSQCFDSRPDDPE